MGTKAPHGYAEQPGKDAFRILSPAKINLFLEIIGRRADGYHDLFSLMCPVSLFDVISCSLEASRSSVSCTHPHVPQDETNIAMRAARLFLSRVASRRAVAIEIDKHIPVGAGLGGGSSNAASVLTGLNRFFGEPCSRGELKSMARSLGADVPFFIEGRPALAEGIGDRLTPVSGALPTHLLILYPNLFVSTRIVYQNLNLALTKYKKKFNYFFFKESNFDCYTHLWNDLEGAAFSLYPGLRNVKGALLKLGAQGALMSGSGSSFFGIFPSRAAAEMALERGRAEYKEWEFFGVEILGEPMAGRPPAPQIRS